MSCKKHKALAPKTVSLGILTVSTTRTIANDKSGLWIALQAKKEGHQVCCQQIIPDDKDAIVKAVSLVIQDNHPEGLVLTGGTGISVNDVTIEAVRPLFVKELTAFGPIFAQLSFEHVDSAAILSRAVAGVIEKTVVFCIPGSLKACKLACKSLIFPELGHIVKHITE